MFESLSYEDILKRLLERVPDSLDKREGSVIFDALAPCAMEIKLLYLALDEVVANTFADTASRQFLIRRAAERGLSPKPAACAELRAVCVPADAVIPDGARFSLDGVYFRAAGKLDGGCRVVCEQPGRVGNVFAGELVPVDYIHGLERFYADGLLIPGEDEEDTESFRARYLASFDSHAFGGNVDDYIQKAGAVPGVGAVKVTPVWNGGGTVLLTVLDSEFNAASPELVSRVQSVIDPEPAMGRGLAPIGHSVTVRAPAEFTVDVSFGLVFDEGCSFELLDSKIRRCAEEYLLELRRGWADRSGCVVRVSQLESRIMGIEGIVDIFGTRVCGSSENLEIPGGDIPVLGGIVCEQQG